MDKFKIGYDKPLYILPFDHRATFAVTMFGLTSVTELNQDQIDLIRKFKTLIYAGFKDAIDKGIPREYGAILVEEQFGGKILEDARQNDYTTILTTEKSGDSEFKFEYGNDFRWHIDIFKPNFTKVLIKYNPSDDSDLKKRQKENLKLLSDFSHENNYKFLLEVLVIPTREQILKTGSRELYDSQLRPLLTKEVISDIQSFGIEPDVWKVEGFDSDQDCKEIVQAIKANGRVNVGLVILGRGANEERVEEWLKIGSKVNGVIGFAVGRTVFWDSIEKYFKKILGEEEVINNISNNFQKYCRIFSPNLQSVV